MLEIDFFDESAYLTRIGLGAPPTADEEGLHHLHHAQFTSVPFENLDIQMGRPINLDPKHLFEKLVAKGRGGYCFELNGLMFMALRHFGFAVRACLARVHLGDRISGLTHQVSIVEVQGRLWLVDVGFGAGGPRIAMPIEQGVFQTNVASYRLERSNPWGWLMSTNEGALWLDSYSFDLSYITQADIDVGNHYTSTSPDSHFTQVRTVSIPTPDGRVSLRNHILTTVRDGKSSTQIIGPGAPYVQMLSDIFGIHLGESYQSLKPVPMNQ